jgi:hypothetical protein
MVAFSESRRGAAPVTWTDSETWPTVMVRSTRTTRPSSTVMPVRLRVEKPGFSAVIL